MTLEEKVLEETPEPVERVPNAVHARDVAAGKRYRMRLDGEDTTVQVMRLDRTSPPWARARRTHYICLDERTGREIRVKSASKFLKEVTVTDKQLESGITYTDLSKEHKVGK